MADLTYIYDEEGRPSHVELGGTRHALSEEERQALPPEGLVHVRDTHTTIRSTLEDIKDSYAGGAIIVDIEATHFGYFNQNRYNYLPSGGRKYVDTWTKPHGKPYLVNHNLSSEPRGRVVAAKYVATSKETGYHALDVRIGHRDEIEMILDERALTVSVGSRPVDTVECSVCGHDLYHGGSAPRRYTLEKAPSADWLAAKAPGVYGAFGLTNGELWDYKKDESGVHSVLCRHQRGLKAPRGGKVFDEVGWYLHGQTYREVSRVNVPADVNEATGEFAHIRGIIKQTDGLDPEVARQLIIDSLSRVGEAPRERARFQVVSEADLFYPATAHEAVEYVDRAGLDTLFERGLWLTVQAQTAHLDQAAQVKAYWTCGGRFVAKDLLSRLSPADALRLDDPSQFGRWLRLQNELSREEKASLDRIYTRSLIRRLAQTGPRT